MFIRGGQIVADVVVIGVTWMATYRAHREGYTSRLLTIMFRNGKFLFPATSTILMLTPVPGTLYFL